MNGLLRRENERSYDFPQTDLATCLRLPWTASGVAGGEQALEEVAGALFGSGIAQQPVGVVIAEGDGVEVESELLGIEVGAEVAGLDGDAGGLGEGGDARPVRPHEEIALRAGSVVELHRGGDEDAAAGRVLAVDPGQPALEQGADARLAAGSGESRADDLDLEALDRGLEDLELQLVLGAEVGEETALREAELGREGADGQPFQPVAAGEADCLVEDALAGLGSLAHREPMIRTVVLFCKPHHYRAAGGAGTAGTGAPSSGRTPVTKYPVSPKHRLGMPRCSSELSTTRRPRLSFRRAATAASRTVNRKISGMAPGMLTI